MARVNKANFRTYRDGETVTASEFNKIKDIFPEAINHIEDTLRDGQRLVDIENVNKEQDERLDSHDEQQAQTDQHLEQLDTRCDEQDEVLADHETRITTATSENSRQDEVIHNINERLREVEDNNADIKIVTVFANNIQKVETFVASEGQQEFQLQKGHYIPGQNRIQMFVDGVQQTLDDGFMEVGSRTIRFTEPLKAGMKVTAHYFTEEASDDLTDIMETIKEGPAILEGLIQNGESSINGFIQNGENTINGFLAEGEREVEDLVTKGENAFDNLVQRAEQVKADSILVQPTKPKPSDNCDIWFDTSEDDFLTLQDYEEARNQAFNNQMATFESRFSEIKGEKGDKGEPGVGVLESDFKDYMGDVHETLREVHKANVEYTVRTAVGEFNHLDYEGQHITANHSIEGHVKSAILKGNTLVNVGTYKTKDDFFAYDGTIDNDSYITITAVNGSFKNAFTKTNSMIKPSTKYLIVFDIVENTLDTPFAAITLNNNAPSDAVWTTDGHASIPIGAKGVYKFIRTTKSDLSESTIETILRSYVGTSVTTGTYIKYRTMIIEYQEGMEHWDIPFFTGMQSVKMPVLTATGKNLFNHTGFINEPTNTYSFKALPTNEQYVLSVTEKDTSVDLTGIFFGLTVNGANFNDGGTWLIGNGLHTPYRDTDTTNTKIRAKYMSYFPKDSTTLEKIMQKFDIQLEKGSQPSSYEPFKSNILTVDGEYGSVGGIEDVVDLTTGKATIKTKQTMVTSENVKYNWSNDTHTCFYISQNDMIKGYGETVKSNLFPSGGINEVGSKELVTSDGAKNIIFSILNTRLSSTDLTGVIKFLEANELNVRYLLATESVKTVVLSDNVVYSYDEVTHYDGSSEDGSLVPTVAVKVPTDVQAVITDQSATIQTLEQENQALKKTQDTLLVVQLGMMEHIATTLAESEEQPAYLKALRQLASERGLI